MKVEIENIIRGVLKLNDPQQNFIHRQLKKISTEYEVLKEQNLAYRQQISGVKTSNRKEVLLKAIELLKLHGYDYLDFDFFKEDFLTWFLSKTMGLVKYKPKEITYTILKSFQEAYNLFTLEYSREPETYSELRNFVFNWREILTEKQINQIANLFPEKNLDILKREISYGN